MNDSPNQTNEPDRWEADFRQWGQRPQPVLRPFFYTRLQARLRTRLDQTGESATPFWLRRPVYAYSALSLLVLLNVGVVIGLSMSYAASDDQPPVSSVFQDEYSIEPYITAYE